MAVDECRGDGPHRSVDERRTDMIAYLDAGTGAALAAAVAGGAAGVKVALRSLSARVGRKKDTASEQMAPAPQPE